MYTRRAAVAGQGRAFLEPPGAARSAGRATPQPAAVRACSPVLGNMHAPRRVRFVRCTAHGRAIFRQSPCPRRGAREKYNQPAIRASPPSNFGRIGVELQEERSSLPHCPHRRHCSLPTTLRGVVRGPLCAGGQNPVRGCGM